MQAQTPMRKRTALITGASNGIGAAIALELANDGFDLALTATRVENLAAIVAKVEAAGARTVPLALNLRSLASVERATDDAIAAFGQIDVVVNNAAMPFRKAAVDITPEEWNAVLETNVTGTFFVCQKFGRHFIARNVPGCIINLASTHGVVGYAGVAAYGISKAAIIHMTKMLAVEWAEHGIRVNAIAPGTVETPTRAGILSDPQMRQGILGRVPLHRFGTPEEMASAVRYLASPAAAYITGQTLLLDGGLTACGARGTGPK
jgi:NAD(P)-dependent dehydrogenase (short-subunit alcohol dehydrogenase family)